MGEVLVKSNSGCTLVASTGVAVSTAVARGRDIFSQLDVLGLNLVDSLKYRIGLNSISDSKAAKPFFEFTLEKDSLRHTSVRSY